MRSAAIALLASAVLATLKADTLTLTLDQPVQAASPGALLSFTGTLGNADTLDVYLNGTFASLPYFELAVDLTPFFTFVPLSLQPGETYIGPLFDVSVSLVALPGDYAGYVVIQGGPDPWTFEDLASASFSVAVVPEPSPAALLCPLLVFCCLVALRRRTRHISSASDTTLTTG